MNVISRESTFCSIWYIRMHAKTLKMAWTISTAPSRATSIRADVAFTVCGIRVCSTTRNGRCSDFCWATVIIGWTNFSSMATDSMALHRCSIIRTVSVMVSVAITTSTLAWTRIPNRLTICNLQTTWYISAFQTLKRWPKTFRVCPVYVCQPNWAVAVSTIVSVWPYQIYGLKF